MDNIALLEKLGKLQATLRDMGKVAVAFSGGVDSSLLLALAVQMLGAEQVLALTADSPLLTARDRENARQVAEQLGVTITFIPFNELDIAEVAANGPQRCYYCKYARFAALLERAQAAGAHLVHGENTDDASDYRPGLRASRELGVRAPLAEAGLSKADVRILAHQMSLPNWDAPSDACLATRFPVNTALTSESLQRVQRAESALRTLLKGQQMRLRDHGSLARLEVAPEIFEQVIREPLCSAVTGLLRQAGYHYITLDLDGYRTGSTNERSESAK